MPNPERFQFQPKSQEKIQAQAEIFGNKEMQDYSQNEDYEKLLKYSVELGKIKDLNNLPDNLPKELVDLIQKHRDTYIAFLRREKKLRTEDVEQNIELYNQKFKSIIQELKSRMQQKDPTTLPEYLASSYNAITFRITVNGKEYAVKFNKKDDRTKAAKHEIEPMILAKGIPHTAQLTSCSSEDGVMIMELLPGLNLDQFAWDNAPDYSDEQIIQLIEAVKALDDRGLEIDTHPGNFMHDSKAGFSVLDYGVGQGGKLEKMIMSLSYILSAWTMNEQNREFREQKLNELDFDSQEYKEKYNKISIKYYKQVLPLKIRFLTILQDKYPGILSGYKKRREKEKQELGFYFNKDNIMVYRENLPNSPELKPFVDQLEKMNFLDFPPS